MPNNRVAKLKGTHSKEPGQSIDDLNIHTKQKVLNLIKDPCQHFFRRRRLNDRNPPRFMSINAWSRGREEGARKIVVPPVDDVKTL
jgi:hypothetical protein